MTSIEASLKLIEWFSENNSFYHKDDINKIKGLPKIDANRIEATFSCALEILKDRGLIKEFNKTGENNEKIWILNAPLDSFVQNISCSTKTTSSISNVINNFLSLLNQDISIKSDPFNIAEEDLMSLIYIIETIADRLQTLEDSNIENNKKSSKNNKN